MPPTRVTRPRLRPDNVFYADSPERALLDAAAPESADELLRRVPVLGRRGELSDDLRRPALAAEACAGAVPLDALGEIDAEAVAEWIAGRYRDEQYSAVVLGSPHGGAVHLAAALGAAWLPTSFTVRVPWPGGSADDWTGAADAGGAPVGRIIAANPSVTVRQVHDPILDGPLCAATMKLHVRWRRLPSAYGNFLRSRLRPGAMSLVFRDVRTWPVLDVGAGHSLQIGSPVSGLGPKDLRPSWGTLPRYAEGAGEPALEPQLRQVAAESGHTAHRVLYRDPAALSALVADLYRECLPPGGTCLVETGRLLDPRGVRERGLVPYWCESAASPAVGAAEQWLAGSLPFERVAVLPEPPGVTGGAHAGLNQWRSVAAFGSRGGWVDRQAAGRYPRLPVARSNAVRMTAEVASEGRTMPPMKAGRVLTGLRRQGPLLGMFVG